MKKLFTLALAFVATLATFAQNTADWQKGDNVAAAIGLGDVDGSFSGSYEGNSNGDNDVKTIGDYWKGDCPVEYHGNGGASDPGIIGFYNVDLIDIYQVVKIPAGSYTLKAQALYREGTPQDNFKNHFAGKFTKNGHMYVDFVSDAEGTTVVRDFDRVLCTLATANQHTALFYDSDGSWKNDAEYKVATDEVDESGATVYTSYFCPCCLPGLAVYFANGKYENEINFVCTEDTYIKIGFRKTGYIKQDWLPFTNVRVIYNGPADEEAQMEIEKEECQQSIAELEEVQNKVQEAGFEGLAGAISDLVMEYNDLVDDAKTVDALNNALKAINSSVDNYTKALSHVNTLSDLLNMSSDMLASTSFPGLSEFQTSYDQAVSDAGTSDVSALGDDPGAYYDGVYNTLSKARADYLNSQPANEKGAKDFTALIKSPWFVNAENTPVMVNGNWELQNAPEWNVWEGPGSFSDRVNEGRPNIASNVDVSTDATVTNQWYKYFGYSSGWCAGIDMMSGSHLVSMSTGWSSGFVGEAGVRQQLVGLPNGYYSVNCLVKGWDACSTYNSNKKILGCMAQNSEEVAVYSVPSENTGNWWSWGWDWDDVQTSIISISDGKLLIGGGGSISNQVTGFRLSFYGENPDFNQMITDKLAYLDSQMGSITFAGDIKNINDIKAQIVQPITDPDAYEAALVPISDAQNYIDKAKSAMSNYTALDTFAALADYEFTLPGQLWAIGLGESEEDTYEKVDGANALANAYKSYVDMYSKCAALDDAQINAIIKSQTDAMTQEVKDVETIEGYINDLSLPYNIAVMAQNGAAEATEANPADVTTFIVNPTFTDDPTTGWSGETPSNNEYAYDTNGKKVNAELWNKSAFTLSQTINGLPAGTYELRAKAVYRDGGSVTQDLVDAYNAAGNEEAWANHNALLFAKTSDDNNQTSYIKAIESLKYTQNSFTEVATAWETEELEDGTISAYPNSAVAIEGTTKTYDEGIYGSDATEGSYPFDTKIGDYYYPSSMQGFLQVCKQHPEDVTNKVQITIETGEALTIGIQKTAAIGSDWVIFDDFELYYLSGDTFKKVSDEMKQGPVADLLAADAVYIYNAATEEVFVGTNNQNTGYASYESAAAGTEMGVNKFKMVERTIDGTTYYQFVALTPAGENYGIWGANPSYINSQPAGGVSFILGQDQDVTNGSAWELIWDSASKTYAIKNVASGFYLGAPMSETAINWTISTTLPETTGIATVAAKSNAADGKIYNIAGQRVANNYKGIVIKNGKKYMIK